MSDERQEPKPEKMEMPPGRAWFGLAAGAIILWALTSTETWERVVSSPSVENLQNAVYKKVLEDELKQLKFLTDNGGSYADLCVHAGLVSAALMQVGDAKQFKEWKPSEEKMCQLAMSGAKRP
jgi:hypothetical protein